MVGGREGVSGILLEGLAEWRLNGGTGRLEPEYEQLERTVIPSSQDFQ